MDIIDKLTMKNENLEKQQEDFQKDLQAVKKIINNKFNDKNGLFVIDFIKKYIFGENKQIDLNPQMLAFHKGKEFVYKQFLTLFDKETIINFINNSKEF